MQKHIQQYHLDKPFDFTAFENEDMSGYGVVAAKILGENEDGFYRKSLHEMGCGNGDFVAYVKQSVLKDWEISAEDFSEVAINSAKEKCPEVDYFINAVVDYFKGGKFTVHIIQIINGKASLWGEVIDGTK